MPANDRGRRHDAVAICQKTVHSRLPSGRLWRPLNYMGLQEGGHAVPGLVGAGDVVGGAALVGEGVGGVVAVDLVLGPGSFERLFEIVDRGRGAPIVLVGEMALERYPNPGRVGEILGRDAV